MVRRASDVKPTKPRSGGVARPDAVYAEDEDEDTGATTLRQAAPPLPAEEDGPEARKSSRPVPALEGAARKPSRPVPAMEGGAVARKPSRPVPAVEMDEAALEEHVARRRPMGLYAAIAVLLVIATAATTALLMGQRGAPGLTAPVANVGPGKDSTAPASGTGVKPAAVAGTSATATGAPGAAGKDAVAPGTGTSGTAASPVPGTPSTGTPATGTQVAGAPVTGTTPAVPAGGQGTSVASAVPSSATAGSVTPGKPDTAGTTHPPPPGKSNGGKKRPAAPAPAPESAPAPAPVPEKVAKYVTPAKVLKLIEEKGQVFVSRDPSVTLRQGEILDVVGTPAKNGRYEVLGKASVVESFKDKLLNAKRVQLRLDEDALNAEGTLLLAVPQSALAASGKADAGVGSGSETEEAPSAEVTPEKPPLYASARKQKGLSSITDPGIRVHNMGTTAWTQCKVVKSGRFMAWLGDVPPRTERTVNENRFKFDPKSNVGSSEVGIFCNEGKFITELR